MLVLACLSLRGVLLHRGKSCQAFHQPREPAIISAYQTTPSRTAMQFLYTKSAFEGDGRSSPCTAALFCSSLSVSHQKRKVRSRHISSSLPIRQCIFGLDRANITSGIGPKSQSSLSARSRGGHPSIPAIVCSLAHHHLCLVPSIVLHLLSRISTVVYHISSSACWPFLPSFHILSKHLRPQALDTDRTCHTQRTTTPPMRALITTGKSEERAYL